jgi:hypothetical protein
LVRTCGATRVARRRGARGFSTDRLDV